MSRAQDRIREWIMSHIAHPEKVTEFDRRMIDFIVYFAPNWVGMAATFSVLSFIYLWLYSRYGIERVLILMLVSIMISIGQLRKAFSS